MATPLCLDAPRRCHCDSSLSLSIRRSPRRLRAEVSLAISASNSRTILPVSIDVLSLESGIIQPQRTKRRTAAIGVFPLSFCVAGPATPALNPSRNSPQEIQLTGERSITEATVRLFVVSVKKRRHGAEMRCPYCGDRRTEVLKTVYRGRSSYRHRRCCYCGARFSTQERPVRWSRVERKWPGICPSRNGWKKHRVAALKGRCEVESCGADFKQAGVRRHVAARVNDFETGAHEI
jgi:hypothetical protein